MLAQNTMKHGRRLEIVGAGPAGLSAALAARSDGAEVVVYEKRSDVGARFHGDFQGLENWTSETDVLAELENCGIDTKFHHTPVREIICFDSAGRPYPLRAARPIFYLVRRGSEEGTLDHALKRQALAAGVTIEFDCRQQYLSEGGVVAEGPHRADVIAAGYVFETDMANGCYVAVADALAPAGYSYLLVDRGRGTVAACLFEHFHEERRVLDATVAFFRREAGLSWQKAVHFGGTGNFQRVTHGVSGDRLYAGESAGFQDALFGFGLRYALVSGHLAGCCRGNPDRYEQAWSKELTGLNAASLLNRWFYARLRDRGRRMVIRYWVAGQDPRRALQRVYAPRAWKSRLAQWLPETPLTPAGGAKSGCECTWCRCHRDHRGSRPDPA